jgi:hypothetical protein
MGVEGGRDPSLHDIAEEALELGESMRGIPTILHDQHQHAEHRPVRTKLMLAQGLG